MINIYESLLKLRSDLEQLKKDQTLSIEMIEQRLIHSMEDKMVFNGFVAQRFEMQSAPN